MPVDMSTRSVMSNDDVIESVNLDRFRASLKCDLFIPSYVHSLSIATEFVYNYVLSKFPSTYFETIHVAGKHPYDDFRRFKRGDLAKRENPSVAISYTLQYDFNDNNVDDNQSGINKYLRRSMWQRSFFKYPRAGLYIGMDFEVMMINYNFKFKVNTRAEQLDLYNRMRKVFRLGCTETNDIDCDFHLDRDMITTLAKEAGFDVDSNTGEVLDPWNFTRFLNEHSQMPILYKLRLINQHYEYFLRMRNLPVHMDFQNPLDVDDGNQSGMLTTDYNIDFQIAVRFPAPKTFALYNEGKWTHRINVEKDQGIKLYSMKVFDIPEENYKGWPMYGHSDYMCDEDEEYAKDIDIKELFRAPLDSKVGTDLDAIIQDAIDQYINPDTFVEIAVYTNDLTVGGNGRIPIVMDWADRKIIIPDNIKDSYFYLAIYIDRGYVNSKVIQLQDAGNNRIKMSDRTFPDDVKNEMLEQHFSLKAEVEDFKFPDSNLPKPIKQRKAQYVVNRW